MSYNNILIERKLREFLEEDCSFQDITSKIVPETAVVSAKIIAKSEGYVSGLEELKALFSLLKVETIANKKDGDEVRKGEVIVALKGLARNILFGERVSLNLVMHMSAITTTTRKYVNKIKQAGKTIRIACTRKTIPGLRVFEKKAVELGGGDPHRYSLDDMILLKDTHLRYYNGDVKRLLSDVKKTASFSKKIELELEKVEDVIVAAQNGADIVMLDNMTPEQVKNAISLLKKNKLREKILIEVSGGINHENIADYVNAEPDIISTSKITQFPSEQVDVSLRFD